MPDNLSNIHFHYPLQPSRLVKWVQWGCLFVILVLMYHIQSFIIFLFFILLGGSCLYLQLQHTKQLTCLMYLEQKLWSVTYAGTSDIKTIQIEKIIDYQLYFIISTVGKSEKNLLIWTDQLSKRSLKSMKIRAKLK